MKIIKYIWLSALILLFGCNNSEHKNDKSGDKINVISLMPSVTRTIYELNASDQLKGCTSYCITIPSDSIPVVSDMLHPNIEKIVSLKPDVVFVSNMSQPSDIEALKKIGIKIITLPSPKNFDEICTQFTDVAVNIGQKERAQKIINNYRSKLDSIQNSSIKQSKRSMFIQIGTSPIFGVLPDTFMNDYILYTNGENIIKSKLNGIVNREYIITCNPDYIFIVNMDGNANNEIQEWKKFGSLKAVKNNNIYVIDDIACQPTPHAFISTIEQITQTINK